MARQRAAYYGSLPENLPDSGSAPFHVKGILGEARGSGDEALRAALASVAGKSAQRPSIFTRHGFVSQGGFKPPMPITRSGVQPGGPPVSFARDADYAPGTKSFLGALAGNTADLMPALGEHAGPGFHGGKLDPNAPIGTPDMPGARIPYGSTMIPGGQPGSYWDHKPLGGWRPKIPLGSTMIPGGKPGSYWDPKPAGGWSKELFDQVLPDHPTPPVWSRPEYFQERGLPAGAGEDPFAGLAKFLTLLGIGGY